MHTLWYTLQKSLQTVVKKKRDANFKTYDTIQSEGSRRRESWRQTHLHIFFLSHWWHKCEQTITKQWMPMQKKMTGEIPFSRQTLAWCGYHDRGRRHRSCFLSGEWSWLCRTPCLFCTASHHPQELDVAAANGCNINQQIN